MSTSDDALLVQVARGEASQEEIAALTAVLLARAAARGHAPEPVGGPRTTARWRRPERRPSYVSPLSWRVL
ncbi:acyl-CoA carboxylase epsilon subunit [Streptomyces sp. NPDC002589]|uniref:acyl-CoA carboxylase epsilon subunit n=1 Tax=Streptomyces sp. NPDC002589 TaxID=3154420 RepID=UPI0033229D85